MFLKTAWDHMSWLFFPGRFLFPESNARDHRVIGWETVRFVDSQEEVQAVTKATGDVFLGGEGNAFLEVLLGAQSVFRLDHDKHQLARRITGGALTRMAGSDATAILDRHIDEALDEALSRRFTAVAPWTRRLTMRAVSRIVMDIDDRDKAFALFRRFEAATSYTANIITYSKCMWRPKGVFSIGNIAARVVGRVDQIVYEAIAERKRLGAGGESALDALIRAQSEHGYDDAFIRDNIVALLAAGYETTASAIAWMLFWMSHRDAYPMLRAKHAAGDQEYLTAFRNESLRYCPPVEILPRKIVEEQSDAAARVLPDLAPSIDKGTLPMVCPFVHRVHHDASVHAGPDEFTPERFIGRNFRATEFFPFGLGRRFCVGAAVGQRMIDRVLDRVLARGLRFDLRSTKFRPVRRNVIIWPGVFMVARLRQDPEVSA